jgi:cation diffusion facilitator family transporter
VIDEAVTEETGPSGRALALTRFAWLSIVAALVTIALKAGSYLVTGSVGLLSDAAESGVNLVAAAVALTALRIAARPADDNHHFGHGKAEYFSAGVEGLMIFVAAAVIMLTAVERLLRPQPLESLGLGLAISSVASVVNGVVGVMLLRVGRAHRSPALEADGRHLLTDVWTSVGVLVGVLLVMVTGWERLDPIVAMAVGLNILITGYRLIAQSVVSLLDAALPEQDRAVIESVLDRYRSDDVRIVGVRTRASGQHRFVHLTVQVPGDWTVEAGHAMADEVERALAAALPDCHAYTHLEPHHAHAPAGPTSSARK